MDGKDYMVTVDYLSNFWEIDRLENTKASTIVRKLKAHFARYGSPCVVISDNSPQFTSENFKQFACAFDFEHRTSSPYNSKSNGKAESAVKTAKSLLRKNKEGDQFLALLNYRNTPSQSTGTSPAQRFFNRRTRMLLPTCENLLKPKLNLEADIQKLRIDQKRQKKNFDKQAKDLPPLEEGDAVVMQPLKLGKKKWTRATVISSNGRSYNIEAEDGTIYRRNRVHLKKTPDQSSAPQLDTRQPSMCPTGDRPHHPLGSPVTAPAASPFLGSPTAPSAPKVTRRSTEMPATPEMPAIPTSTEEAAARRTTPHELTPRIPVRTRSGREIRAIIMKDFVY
ncbi:hypothetical protein ACOMHN_052344 [Nucella lapillus]